MNYGFDTKDEAAALGALLVYGVYRSRDIKRFKVSPDMWSIIERATKASATRARDLYDFIEKLKPRSSCATLHPKWMKTDAAEVVTWYRDPQTGELIAPGGQGDKRQFWVQELEQADHAPVLKILRYQTARVIALVRDRLEREKPIEAQLNAEEDHVDG